MHLCIKKHNAMIPYCICFQVFKKSLTFFQINLNDKKSFGLNFNFFMDICYHFMHLLYEKYIKKYNDGFC
jgi:hypothetical protein